MNLLQWEFGVLPTKVLKEDKSEYIRALIDTRENEDINIFLDCMTLLHCRHLQSDIDHLFNQPVRKWPIKWFYSRKWSIKPSLAQKMADILFYVADKENFTTEEIISHFGYAETTAKRYLRQLASHYSAAE